MKIPTRHTCWLTFLHEGCTYKVTSLPEDRGNYHLYKQIDSKDYELLGKGNDPSKLEKKVYENKYN